MAHTPEEEAARTTDQPVTDQPSSTPPQRANPHTEWLERELEARRNGEWKVSAW